MRPASDYHTEYCRPGQLKSSSARTRAVLALLALVIAAWPASVAFGWPGGERAAAPAAHTAAGDFAPGYLSAALFQVTTESVQTYAADCTTPKDDFDLGDTICVKADVPFVFLVGLRNINIIGPANVVRASIGVSGLSQTLTFQLPTTEATTLGDQTFDNRGAWRADLSTIFGSRRATASFDVSAPDPAADLQVVAAVDGPTDVASGDEVSVSVYVLNVGPDAAEDVVVTPPSHTGLSLQSFAPENGSDCGGPCTVASLGRRSVAKFTAVYDVAAAAGSKLVAETSAQSDTEDPRPFSNSDFIFLSVTEGAPNVGCTLTCPADVIATANTTVGGNPGAFVKYGSASPEGDCGTISNSPVSNSFFAVGTHTVTASASEGGSCTFTVKVLGTPAPTISCPADKTAFAAVGADDATVAVGSPTFTASGGGTVVGLRSDSTPAVLDDEGNIVTPAVPRPLTDPYPIGVTSILWTVTDADGRTASCTQKVIVSENACASDTTPPTITAPDDITVGTGVGNTGCSITLDDELGQPEVSDACTVTVTILGLPPGSDFAPGTYTLTYKATDSAGNEATDTQVVTVIENTPPVIEAPPDATYTCLSEVPAASPSQATRGDVFDEDGNLLPPGPPFDNCGVPVVTVTETATGVGSATNPRVITRTFRATDAAGNFAEDVQTITVADGTAPTLTVPANVTVFLPLNTPDTSMAVTYPAATASDNCGTVTISYSHPSGSVFNVGTTTVTVTATDAVGNQTTGTFTVTVLYNFTGFFQPVDNPTTLNVVNAGRAIPVKFSLSGNKGLDIFAANSPYTVGINCDGSLPQSDVEETLTAGGSSLSYNATSDQYNYVWKTESSWAGTCRQLVVVLNDGSTHTALFKFR